MADRIKANFGAIDTAAADLNAGSNQMQQRMEALRADVAPMLGSWDGAARESYFAAQRKWDQGWAELQQALAQMGSKTGETNGMLQAGEQSRVGLFNA